MVKLTQFLIHSWRQSVLTLAFTSGPDAACAPHLCWKSEPSFCYHAAVARPPLQTQPPLLPPTQLASMPTLQPHRPAEPFKAQPGTVLASPSACSVILILLCARHLPFILPRLMPSRMYPIITVCLRGAESFSAMLDDDEPLDWDYGLAPPIGEPCLFLRAPTHSGLELAFGHDLPVTSLPFVG